MNPGSFINLAIDREIIMVAAGIYVLLRLISRFSFAKIPTYRRVLPFLPEILGCLVVFYGGVSATADLSTAAKIAVGLWCGYLASKFHKILGQTILGDDHLVASKMPQPLREGSIPPQEGAR